MQISRFLFIFTIFLFCACESIDDYGSIRGTVKNENGDPVPMATVSTFGKSEMTDDNGNYLIMELELGEYEVLVTHDNYQTSEKSISISSGKNELDFKLSEKEYEKPNAEFSVSPESGYLSIVFEVDASGSTDEQNETEDLKVCWRWEAGNDFSDWTNIKTASHQYQTEGEKIITLQVKNSFDLIDVLEKNITVTENLPPNATFTVTPQSATTGANINTDASELTDDQTLPENIQIRWTWETEEEPTNWTNSKTGLHQYNTSGLKIITLEAKDEQGLISSISETVEITEGETEPENNDCLTAQQINVNSIIFCDIGYRIYSNDTEDWFKLTMPANGQLSVIIENTTPTNIGECILYYNSCSNELVEISTNGIIPGNTNVTSSPAGVYSGAVYYIKISQYENEGSFYKLSLNFQTQL